MPRSVRSSQESSRRLACRSPFAVIPTRDRLGKGAPMLLPSVKLSVWLPLSLLVAGGACYVPASAPPPAYAPGPGYQAPADPSQEQPPPPPPGAPPPVASDQP